MNTGDLLSKVHMLRSLAVKTRLIAHNPEAFLRDLSRDMELVERKPVTGVGDLMGIPVEYAAIIPSGEAWLVVQDGIRSQIVAIVKYNEGDK